MNAKAMNVAGLLTESQSACRSRRQHTLVEFAADRSSEQVDAALGELWADGANARVLALELAVIRRRGWLLDAALDAPEFELRRAAFASVPLADLSVDRLVAATVDAPSSVRLPLYRRIRREKLTAVADALFAPILRRHGAAEAARLLPGCGAETVGRELPGLAHAVDNWTTLARRHPEIVLAHAERELAELPRGLRAGWWGRHTAAIDALAEVLPAQVLDLLERYDPPLFPRCLAHRATLASAEPARTARLLAAPQNRDTLQSFGVGRSVLRALVKADPPELLALGVALRRTRWFVRLLRALPPSRRAEFFTAVYAGTDLTAVLLDEKVLTLLPRELRAEHARRQRKLRLDAGDRAGAAAMLVHLPLAEARDELRTLSRRRDAEDRALGYTLLIRCAAADADHDAVAELLGELAERLRREQEPVRGPALTTLAAVHPRAFTPVSLPVLEAMLTDALDARDSSPAVGSAVAEIGLSLVVSGNTDTGLSLLRTWWRRGLPGRMPDIAAVSRRGQEHELYAALAPDVDASLRRKRFSDLESFVDVFGPRMRKLPDLVATLADAVRRADEYQRIGPLWRLLAIPGLGLSHAERLLGERPELVRAPTLREKILCSWTHLVEQVLAPARRRRLFGGRDTEPVVPLGGYPVHRWSWRDRETYARLLTEIADDPDRQLHHRAQAVASLGRLGALGRETVRRHLPSGAPEYVGQAALNAYIDCAEPDAALEVLLAVARPTESARESGQAALAAMYSVRRCASRMRPSELDSPLRTALAQARAVTVRKELLRLLLDVHAPGAVEVLAETFAAPDAHRDVRAACVAACVAVPEDAGAWAVLTGAVGADEDVCAPLLGLHPAHVAPSLRADVADLLASVVGGLDLRRAAGMTVLANWVTWSERARVGLRDAVTDLGTDRRTMWAALNGVVSLAREPVGERTLIEITGALAAAEEPANAEADRDLPALQRLRRLVGKLAETAKGNPPAYDTLLRRVAAELTAHPPLAASVLTTALRVEDPDGPAAVVSDVDGVLTALGDRPTALPAIADRARNRVQSAKVCDTPAVLVAARELAARAERASGLLATALISGGGQRLNWPETWRTALRDLRTHPHPEVRDHATATTTATE